MVFTLLITDNFGLKAETSQLISLEDNPIAIFTGTSSSLLSLTMIFDASMSIVFSSEIVSYVRTIYDQQLLIKTGQQTFNQTYSKPGVYKV